MRLKNSSRCKALSALLLVAALGLVSCSDDAIEIRLAETRILSGAGTVALVTELYGRVYERAEVGSPIVWHVRRGDILGVLTRTPDLAWLEIDASGETGWVEASIVRLYAGREQATNAARALGTNR